MRARTFLLYTALLSFIAPLPAAAQTAQPEGPVMVEDVFKNVQVLKGIPVGEFMDTMGFVSAALGLNCTACHVAESLQDWSRFADDVPRKQMARAMMVMVNGINRNNFGGRRVLTCWSCHRGVQVPEVTPSLAVQYTVAEEDPNAMEIVPSGPQEPTATQILDKYIQAVGSPQALARLTSFLAKGTLEGFDTYQTKVPFEMYAKAPNQRTVIWHKQIGDTTVVFDGRAGWVANVNLPVRLLPMAPGAELDGGQFDAALAFPGNVKTALSDWRVGFPPTTIEDKLVNIVQGTGAGKTRFKLYFEDETGLLVRQVRYAGTPIGMVPTQVDYSDYRDVAGVKLPHKIVITWTDGRSSIELNEIQPNVAIDSARFARPALAVMK